MNNNKNVCYKRLFNTLNYQSGHFPPPEFPNEKKYFPYFIDLFMNLLNIKHAKLLLQEALIKEVYKNLVKIMNNTSANENLLIMILSTITPRERKEIVLENVKDRNYAKESINNSWKLFTTWYTPSEYGSLSKKQYTYILKEVLSRSLHLVSILKENKTDNYESICICNPVLFGMGDQEWEKFIVKILALLLADENDPLYQEKVEYGVKVFNLAEQYLFSDSKAAKLHKAWQPPLYRVIPSQLDSYSNPSMYNGLIKAENLLYADGFAKWIHPMLWEWDKIESVLYDNGISFARSEKCGCMGEHAIVENSQYKKRASEFLNMYNPELSIDDFNQLFSFCISFRNKLNDSDEEGEWLPVFKDESNELSDSLKQNLETSEDFNLLHTVFNFKKSDPSFCCDYLSFLCNCHRNWCLQLRPQNECSNQTAEGKKIEINGIQKAFYNVSLTGGCGDCKDCFQKENTNDTAVEFVCPVYAFSDRTKCIGCLLCVRHCYMKHGSVTEVESVNNLLEVKTRGLKVTRVLNEEDLPLKVPETGWDRDKQRIEAALKGNPEDRNWQNFQYQI